MLRFEDLTQAQRDAVAKWEVENDPDGYSFECRDNDRLAVVGNREQEEAYDASRMNGCCGFVDVELDCEDGTVLLYGFNYGH